MNKSKRISRRTILRGAGVAMALPWMESLPAFADSKTPSPFPKRFGVLFMGTGINEDHWSAEGQGSAMKLSKTLSQLEPLKQKINVIDGLFVKALTGQGIHPAQTGSLLSGANIAKGAIIHSGISVDQMIANSIGQDTPQSSLVARYVNWLKWKLAMRSYPAERLSCEAAWWPSFTSRNG